MEERMETMDDYKKELDASFKRVEEGDILTGTVIGIGEDEITLDLQSYTEGIITKDHYSNDPDCVLKETVQMGEEVTATVLKTDDGHGHILLSKKEANDILAWEKMERCFEDKSTLQVKVDGVVKGGAVAYVEGIRGFIPASKLDSSYVENLEEWLGRELEVQVITVDREAKKLVLSARELAYARKMAEKQKKIASCEVGAVSEGVVESIQNYGAFVKLDNGATGLLHVSQISDKRIKSPSAVLSVGQRVTVKITALKDGKLSLSMKALHDVTEPEDTAAGAEYTEDGQASTSLGALLKGFKLD
ncbi:S1 RNA-binding domain-containing protein [Qiania dongpingensis]|uniref:S1 RNA-binding domain-containing protein n=1 Tax=Qiania dongpingensis TaxID=2763669 RepID=A0A7G9G1F3_9FIRM|nr:S1 RNA-binding domain-containing protein [Qiania dongpingensis]QNM04635.1 S1 RNA-binding domain-containing protein [Qiania dongpingensis]